MNGALAVGASMRALRHVGNDRWLEVLLLQASPLLGLAFGAGQRTIAFGPPALLLLGSVLLTAHVFVFNDWAGRHADLNDSRRSPRAFVRHGIDSDTVVALAIALLVAALVALAAVGFTTVVVGAGIACLGVLYSDTDAAGKGVPGLASLLHLLGGASHFLLGYQAVRPIDLRGLAIAAFFGLVFAGGHLNQEVRDHVADRRNGIRTTAVMLGPQRALLASLALFTAAYGVLAVLAAAGHVPRPLLWAAGLLWPVHGACSWRALGAGSPVDQAHWLQRRYRLLFALVGLVIVLSLAAAR